MMTSLRGGIGGEDKTKAPQRSEDVAGIDRGRATARSTQRQRLRSVALYKSLGPQAMACSGPVVTASTTTTTMAATAAAASYSSPSSSSSPLSSAYVNGRHDSAEEEKDDDNASNSSLLLASSLGAVAGTHGVAVFATHLPHRPRLVLSLVASSSASTTTTTTTATTTTTTGSTNNVVSSLAFQPVGGAAVGGIDGGGVASAAAPLYLAAARGDGVLVWDVSGHSLSPLWGRWSTRTQVGASDYSYGRHAYAGGEGWAPSANAAIVDLCWHSTAPGGSRQHAAAASDRYDCLLALTSTHACLWDVRVPPATATSSLSSSTALRFAYGATISSTPSAATSTTATAHEAHGPRSPLVQVASQGHICAIMNRAGFLHVYDTRMAATTGPGPGPGHAAGATGGALAVVPAFHHAGVGVASYSIPSEAATRSGDASSTGWVTWGIDSSPSSPGRSEPVVKVWSIGAGNDSKNSNLSAAPSSSIDNDEGGGWDAVSGQDHPGYRLVASRSVANLCCARVGPAPFQDSIVTVAMEQESHSDSDGLWTAQVWKIAAGRGSSDGESGGAPPAQLEAVATFLAGSDSVGHRRRELSPLVDGTSLGQLFASELASVVAVRSPRKRKSGNPVNGSPSSADGNENKDDDNNEDEEDDGALANQSVLLLCSLTDAGYLTTHEIPEATPSSPSRSRRGEFGKSRKALPNLGIARQGMRVFPAGKDAPVGDAARAWAGEPGRGSAAEPPGTASSHPWQPQDGVAATGGPAADGEGGGGAPLPFDMELSALAVVANGAAENGAIAVPHLATANADPDQTTKDARDATDLMQRIETDRIPCPRLCGATFGPGIGGLVSFNNGDIRRMWSWWERTDPSRSSPSSAPSVIGELLLSDDTVSSTGKFLKRGCPRTLKDLMAMTLAAKEAQWGDQDGSDASSTGFQAPGPSFFEDGSVGSTESGDDDDDVVDDKDMYDSYFGESQRPLLDGGATPNRVETENLSPDRKLSEPYGPSSDSLAPVVHVTRQFEKQALSSQRIELANAWKLGPITQREPIQDRSGAATKEHKSMSTRSEDAAAPLSSPSRGRLPTSSGGLPPYRFLVPPSQPPDRFQRSSSDPQLQRGSNKVFSEVDDERGVHGGDYGVRPNMQESMVFLRKLFTHQQDGGSNFPALYSPPDGPMLPNSRSHPAVPMMSAPSGSVLPFADAFDEPKQDGTKTLVGSRVGLYTIQASDQEQGNLPKRRWKDVEGACLHNARACEALGEDGKRSSAKVWELLAKAVAIRSNVDAGINSFGPFAGGGFALGRRLVSNIFQYYQAQGDVQMLATIVCVLQAGTIVQTARKGALAPAALLHEQWSLLPPGQSEKFDVYIRRYGDLLFSWGLLTTRAELIKHLTSTPLDVEAEHATAKGLGSTIAVVPSFVCPRCARETEGSSFCDTCNVFSFRCVICDNSVRGLFTSCPSCGHGGHTLHMQQWFANHGECPTGCGCECATRTGYIARPTHAATTQPPPGESSNPADEGQHSTGGFAIDPTRSALNPLDRSVEVFSS